MPREHFMVMMLAYKREEVLMNSEHLFILLRLIPEIAVLTRRPCCFPGSCGSLLEIWSLMLEIEDPGPSFLQCPEGSF